MEDGTHLEKVVPVATLLQPAIRSPWSHPRPSRDTVDEGPAQGLENGLVESPRSAARLGGWMHDAWSFGHGLPVLAKQKHPIATSPTTISTQKQPVRNGQNGHGQK